MSAASAPIIWVPLRSGEPLLRLEDERLELGLAQGKQGRHSLSAELDLAPADQGQGQVGERGKVAGRPHAPLFGDDRVDARGEEG